MGKVLHGTFFAPQQKDIIKKPVFKSYQVEELMQLFFDNELDEPGRRIQTENQLDINKVPNKDWLLNIFSTYKPNHEIFRFTIPMDLVIR